VEKLLRNNRLLKVNEVVELNFEMLVEVVEIPKPRL
jgi:hypothetical protein